MPFKKNSSLTLINFFLFASFSLLSILWLFIKLNLAHELNPSLSFIAYVDIIRSQLSLDLALCLVFFYNFLLTSKHNNEQVKYLQTSIASFFYLLIVFYFLKLTGLYAYTHDPTPYSMIEYGTYMLKLPFAGKYLAFLAYLCIPVLLFLSLYLLIFQQARTHRLKKSTYFILLGAITLLISFAFIPSQQKDLEPSIAYHPYIYSAFASQKKSAIENIRPTLSVNNMHSQLNTIGIENRKNIVIVVLESFREDIIREDITPFLYQLKQNSIYFEQTYSAIPHTSKALVTIHCGSLPYLSPYLLESNLGIATDCLAQLLQTHNYQSVFFQSVTQFFENRKALVSSLGFNEFFALESLDKSNFEAVNYFGYEDDIMLPKSKQWLLKRKGDKPFLASYLTGTSHHNYDTPSHFPLRKFHEKNNYNRYLNAVSYVDRFAGKLIQQYKDLGIYHETIFIFIGDHGEGFGEHRPLMHNNNIYNSGLKIPLIIHDGAQTLTPTVTHALTSQSELRDLILSILKDDSYVKHYPTNTIQNPKTIISSCWYSNYCYSLIQQDQDSLYKFILDLANNKAELYDLISDPKEKNNLLSTQEALGKSLEKQLKNHIQQQQLLYDQHYRKKYNTYLDYKMGSFSQFKSVTD